MNIMWNVSSLVQYLNLLCPSPMTITIAPPSSPYKVDIIIIIVSCREHGYPWPSLATSPYRSSPPAGLQGYIPYLHIAALCMFELVVLLLLGLMWGSIGVHHLWARPCFSNSVLHVWFVRTCSILLATFLCNCRKKKKKVVIRNMNTYGY